MQFAQGQMGTPTLPPNHGIFLYHAILNWPLSQTNLKSPLRMNADLP